MAITNFPCLNSADDEQTIYGASTTVTVMRAEHNVDLARTSKVQVHLDTSGIGTDTITAATFHWYNDVDSSKAPKANTYDHNITIGVTNFYNSTTQELAGWQSHDLTSGELVNINKSGDTSFEFFVGTQIDAGYFRTWDIRAWDYAPTGTFSAYLTITHTVASGGPTKMTIISV